MENSYQENIQHYLSNIDPHTIQSGFEQSSIQLFKEDLTGSIVPEDKDTLYFPKSIIRVIANIIGKDTLLEQFSTADNPFAEKFNEITAGQFDAFVSRINQVCIYSHNQEVGTISEQEKKMLSVCKEQLLNFASRLIKQKAKSDPTFYESLIQDFKDDNFLQDYYLLKDIERDDIGGTQVSKHAHIPDPPKPSAQIDSKQEIKSQNQYHSSPQQPSATQMSNTKRIIDNNNQQKQAKTANMMTTTKTISKQSINQTIQRNSITMSEVTQLTDTMLRQQRYKELNHKKSLGTLTLEEDEELKKLQPSFKQQQIRTQRPHR